MAFDLYLGIDYSGAATPSSRLNSLKVYAATEGPPELLVPLPEEGNTHWNWCRKEIAQYLMGLAKTDTHFIAGIDHAFSFPVSYLEQQCLIKLLRP